MDNEIHNYPLGNAESRAVAWALEEALDVVRAAGYVVLKAKSYRQAQERQRVAEALRAAEAESAESARRWARECLEQERFLRERVTYLAALCMKLGATMDQLRGEDDDAQQASYLDFLKPIARYDHSIGRWVTLDQGGDDA